MANPPTPLLELWLIRHGETDWNKERRMQGSSDVPLNQTGLEQAERLAARLNGNTFDRVYSSDLNRAYTTAQIVCPQSTIIRDARLREINLGRYEGKRWDEVPQEEQPLMMVWATGPYHQRVPGGESSDDLQVRVKSWLSELPSAERVAAFTHGGTIGATLQIFTGRPPAKRLGEAGSWSFRLANTSISKLLITPEHVTVEVVNDYAHLYVNY